MAVATGARERDVVYPEDRLPWPQTILMGLQHVMAMFGATVLVPLILGFNPNTVIFFSGVATLIFLVVTGFKVPSYLGSSFSFIGSVLAVQGTSHNHGLAYAGIVMAGVIYLAIGVIVHFVGVNPIRYLLPPVVTGTVVAVIGLALASAATTNYAGEPFTATVTLLAAVGAAVYLRGFPRLLPVLIGIVIGYLVSAVYPACSSATSACHIDFNAIGNASIVGVPTFAFPDFSQFGTTLSLFFFIPVILVAENAGHVYAISGIMKRDLSPMLGRTFIGDGIGTTISGLLGGTGETTYAENIGVMGITRVFSIMVFVSAGVRHAVAAHDRHCGVPSLVGVPVADACSPGHLGEAVVGRFSRLGVAVRVAEDKVVVVPVVERRLARAPWPGVPGGRLARRSLAWGVLASASTSV